MKCRDVFAPRAFWIAGRRGQFAFSALSILVAIAMGPHRAFATGFGVDPSWVEESWKAAGEEKKSEDLWKLKQLENQRQFKNCADMAPSVWKGHVLQRPWILHTWLRCARRSSSGGDRVLKPLELLDRNSDWLWSGAWKNFLNQEQVKARLEWLESRALINSKEAFRQLQKLEVQQSSMETDFRARVWAVRGDLAMKASQLEMAQQFYRQSLQDKEQKSVREKWNSLIIRLKMSEVRSGVDLGPVVDVISDEERQAEQRFQQAVMSNEPMLAVKDGVLYLNVFPVGRNAKSVFEKTQDAVFGFLDSTSVPLEAQGRVLSQIKQLEPSRRLELLRALHRRSVYPACANLAESFLEEKASQISSAGIYLGGRCSHFAGIWAQARKFFEVYTRRFSGAEDVAEAQFRLGLIYLREAQFSSAIATFEKLLLMKNIERYELSSRYWLVRALQWTGNERARGEILGILQKFPFSFYGLRLRAEQSPEKSIEWVKTQAPLPALPKVFWTGSQAQSWRRTLQLVAAGWMFEAQTELSGLSFAGDLRVRAFLARKWASLGAIQPALRVLSDAGDLDPRFRESDFMEPVFPRPFSERVLLESAQAGVSPILIWSLMRQESAFQIRALSSSNALGLMQLIPSTALEVIGDLRLEQQLGGLLVPEDVYDPEVNIRLGTAYLGKMLRQFSLSVPAALAAYNAGPARMSQFL
ncbi:MAG: lytic transglycosylase domain-containing protein, partial [Bdellovibrio sp.]